MVRVDRRSLVLRTEEVHWIEAERSYIRLHVQSGSHLVRESMDSLGARLDPAQFARIHRSRLVNLAQVREVVRWFGSDYLVRLHDGSELRLSRRYWPALKERLGGR